jgi:hypothetical protein
VVSQLPEFIGASHEVSLTIYLYHSPDAPAGMNVGLNHSLGGNTVRLLQRLQAASLPQKLKRLLYISLNFKKGLAASHNARSRLLS